MDIAHADPAAVESHRDRGLVRGVGVTAMTLTIVSEVVGSGIFRLPAGMALAVGGLAPLAYVACGIAMGAVVLCCAEAGSRVPTSGGIYGYVEAGLGPLTGFVGGFIGVWLSALLACGAVAAGLADIAAAAWPALGGAVARVAVIALILGGFALLALREVGHASRLIAIGTAVKLVPLMLVVVVGVWFVEPANLTLPAPEEGGGFGRAMIFAIFAFSGMETSLAVSGEVRDPARTVPRALILAMAGVLALYTALQVVSQGLLGAALATSATPLADAIGTVDPRLRGVLLAGAGVSMLFWIAGDVFAAPRALFAFARDGLLPAALGRLHPRTRVPYVAVLVHAGLAFLLAVTGTFEQLAILAAMATTILYALACVAAWRLRRRGVAVLGTPVLMPALPLAAAIGVAAMAAIFSQAEWSEIGGAGAAVALSALIFVVARRRAGLPLG